jgi:integrase
MVIVQDVPGFVETLKATAGRLYVPAMVALFTSMRRGEVLALRWGCVDLDRKTIRVEQALEHTKAHGIRFKPPKSKAGRRDVTLPDILVDLLRDYRKTQLELRLKLGAGKLQNDDLLFTDADCASPLSPKAVSAAWSDYAARIGMPDVTFHRLRHTHASQLIDQHVDIVTISKRLGHAKPDITLRIYAHLFREDDSKTAEAINASSNNPSMKGPMIMASTATKSAPALGVTNWLEQVETVAFTLTAAGWIKGPRHSRGPYLWCKKLPPYEANT